MFSPTGELGEVPVEKVGDAVKNGFTMGRHVVSSDGQVGIVPENKLADALKGGMKRDRSKPEGPNQLQIGSPEYTSDPSITERILATKPPMKGSRGDFTVPPVDLSKMNPADAHEEIMNAGTATLEGAMTPKERIDHPDAVAFLQSVEGAASPRTAEIIAASEVMAR